MDPAVSLGRPLVRVEFAGCQVAGLNESGRPASERGGPARPHGVIRFQHRRKINCGSPSQALTPYFSGFFWCRRIGMMPTEHLFPKGAATMRDSQPMIASKLELSPCAVS